LKNENGQREGSWSESSCFRTKLEEVKTPSRNMAGRRDCRKKASLSLLRKDVRTGFKERSPGESAALPRKKARKKKERGLRFKLRGGTIGSYENQKRERRLSISLMNT